MRRCSILALLAVLVSVLAACESGSVMSARMRERFQPAQPTVQVFEAERPAVFDAVLDAMRQLNFHVSRSGMAQGIVNAHSRLQAGDSFGKARQYTMEVRLHSFETGKTEVAVVLREQEESASFAGATDLVLREHGLYGSFFTAVKRALEERGGPPGASVNHKQIVLPIEGREFARDWPIWSPLSSGALSHEEPADTRRSFTYPARAGSLVFAQLSACPSPL